METVMLVLQIASYVVAGASVVAAGVAPLTKNKTDDRVAKALAWVLNNVVNKLALNPKP